jgi:protein-S-isoprenylcysteine O-methyltransferase Ste14
MKTKIPPPILALLMIVIIYFSSLIIEPFTFSYRIVLSVFIVVIGLACAIPSFRLFAKHKTTISPFTPSETTALVTVGMYRYSRNPMYLGLVLLNIAATIFFGTWLGIIIVATFIFLLNLLQIIPEEEALLDIFGEEYIEYKKKVRRWI